MFVSLATSCKSLTLSSSNPFLLEVSMMVSTHARPQAPFPTLVPPTMRPLGSAGVGDEEETISQRLEVG